MRNYFFRLTHSCELGDTFLYGFYHFIVRSLECKCCIFYRGLILGFLSASLIWWIL